MTPLAGFTGTVSFSLPVRLGLRAGVGLGAGIVAADGRDVGLDGTRLVSAHDHRDERLAQPYCDGDVDGDEGRPVGGRKARGPRTAPALSLVTLDARGTTGAARYLWDVTGDRRPDV